MSRNSKSLYDSLAYLHVFEAVKVIRGLIKEMVTGSCGGYWGVINSISLLSLDSQFLTQISSHFLNENQMIKDLQIRK